MSILFLLFLRYFIVYEIFSVDLLFVMGYNINKKRGETKKLNERLKKLRKTLDLTQQAFADRIGMKQNTIAQYEMGRTVPSAAIIFSICREFNVNENWLRTGEGEMFVEMSRDEQIETFVGNLLKNEDDSFKRRLVSGLAALDETGWDILENFLKSIQSEKG